MGGTYPLQAAIHMEFTPPSASVSLFILNSGRGTAHIFKRVPLARPSFDKKG